MRWFVAVAVIGISVSAQADTVYKSVDEQGVVEFSDTPPTAASAEVEVIEVQPPQASDPEAYQARLAAMRETTERMAQDRREREAQREKQRERQNQQVAQQDHPVVEQYYPYPVYHYSPHRSPFRPHAHLPPRHPVPQSTYSGNNNAQLMRPITYGSGGLRGGSSR